MLGSSWKRGPPLRAGAGCRAGEEGEANKGALSGDSRHDAATRRGERSRSVRGRTAEFVKFRAPRDLHEAHIGAGRGVFSKFINGTLSPLLLTSSLSLPLPSLSLLPSYFLRWKKLRLKQISRNSAISSAEPRGTLRCLSAVTFLSFLRISSSDADAFRLALHQPTRVAQRASRSRLVAKWPPQLDPADWAIGLRKRRHQFTPAEVPVSKRLSPLQSLRWEFFRKSVKAVKLDFIQMHEGRLRFRGKISIFHVHIHIHERFNWMYSSRGCVVSSFFCAERHKFFFVGIFCAKGLWPVRKGLGSEGKGRYLDCLVCA